MRAHFVRLAPCAALMCILLAETTLAGGERLSGTAQRRHVDGEDVLSPVVYVLAFPAYGAPLVGWEPQTREIVADLALASSYHRYKDPAATPFVQYELYEDTVFIEPRMPPVTPKGFADYGWVYEQHGLCRLVEDREIDEVWFVEAGPGDGVTRGHMSEWVTTGPGWPTARFYPSSDTVNAPTCGERHVTTMMFNLTLDSGYALHAMGHRLEAHFMVHAPCDFLTETWPWAGRQDDWLKDCPPLDRDRFAFGARPQQGNGYVGGCGGVHHPPNITTMEDYVYNSREPARTICPDWSQDGSARLSTVTCADWGCDQRGFMLWWMQNIPGRNNTNRTVDGRVHSNWWPMMFGEALAPASTSTPTVRPSPTRLPTPSPTEGTERGWRLLSEAGPDARYTHGMAYDAHRQTVVLFGGDDSGGARCNDTWELPPSGAWQRRSLRTSPPGRVNIHQSMVYDTARRRIVLFGGLGDGYLNDTWFYDGVEWAETTMGTRPPARDSHAMAYDSRRQVTVMFGGYSASAGYMNDTWEYDGSEWTERTDVGRPTSRFGHAMAFDPLRGVTVLVGGGGADGVLSDTWEYDGVAWRRVAVEGGPPARVHHALAYDPGRETLVLFGGCMGSDGRDPMGDTWEYAVHDWSRAELRLQPAPRCATNLVYSGDREALVMYGGGHWSSGRLTVLGDLWQYQTARRLLRFVPSALRR